MQEYSFIKYFGMNRLVKNSEGFGWVLLTLGDKWVIKLGEVDQPGEWDTEQEAKAALMKVVKNGQEEA